MTARDSSLVRVTLRPLPEWPYPVTGERRPAHFKSGARRNPETGGYTPGRRVSYETTLSELRYEVWQLDGDAVVLGVGLRERDVRLDGAPRADAGRPLHPGVEVSFDSRYGRLTYATDVFDEWRDNVRAIAKGLEALRAVARWGVAKRGQQYAGFAMLSAGPSLAELGRALVAQHGGIGEALRATHPDTGGPTASSRDFQAVMAFRKERGE